VLGTGEVGRVLSDGFLAARFGWETEALGGAAAARAIEPLCMLGCIPGFPQNRWGHALKMLR